LELLHLALVIEKWFLLVVPFSGKIVADDPSEIRRILTRSDISGKQISWFITMYLLISFIRFPEACRS